MCVCVCVGGGGSDVGPVCECAVPCWKAGDRHPVFKVANVILKWCFQLKPNTVPLQVQDPKAHLYAHRVRH